MSRIRIIITIIVVVLTTLLTGCTGKEPNEIAYVVALGIDSTDDDNYKITIQYANTTQISGGASESGGKAFNRRKDMGEISGKRADRIFLVPDDPGNEDPQAICEEIGGYIAKEGASFQIRMDRGAAIREAILGAVPGEVVLILGKGADVTMHVGNGNVPYRSDAVYAKEALAEYGNAFAEAATARETEE